MGYWKRTADTVLKEQLEAFGAVLIEGSKWCGKMAYTRPDGVKIIPLGCLKN